MSTVLLARSFAISIHAPARGATSKQNYTMLDNLFQSTLPQGERLQSRITQCWTTYFNPRSREGSDRQFDSNIDHIFQFQSTLPRRERRFFQCLTLYCNIISIHAPAKGATYWYIWYTMFCYISIHAPAKGATRLLQDPYNFRLFQSTLPRGERHRTCSKSK